jgi:SAM-dependent methyltransferase
MSFATPLVEHLVRSAFDLLGFDIKRRRRAIRTRPSIKKRTTFDGSISGRFKMYHIGCGPDIVDEFLNIDGYFDSWFEYNLRCPYNLQSDRLYAVRGKPSTYVLQHDLRNGIPAASDSSKVIYHSHFLEHLTDDQGIAFLSECHRCLAPGGSMRFAVPDLTYGAVIIFQEIPNSLIGTETPILMIIPITKQMHRSLWVCSIIGATRWLTTMAPSWND